MSARIDRLRAGLERDDLTGVIATPGVNFTYLTGQSAWRTERLTCLGVPRAGTAWLVCPAFERGHLEKRIPWVEVTGWDETEDPFALVAKKVGEQPGRWAFEPTTAYHDATRLIAASDVPWVDGAHLFERLRRAKDEADIEALVRAIGIAWDVYEDIVGSLDRADTEREVAARFSEAFRGRGADGWSLVQFGANSADPHADAGDSRLGDRGAVLFDWGGWIDGFTADLTRAFWWEGGIVAIEDAPDAYRRVHDLVREAQAAGLAALGPGAVAGDVDEAARRVIRDAGHGDHFTHRLGHGLGREIHEPPYLVAASTTRLAPGDVVTVEPGVYLPGEFGVRWEDNAVVTDDGIDILSLRGERYAGVRR